jgi:hypothetical protein
MTGEMYRSDLTEETYPLHFAIAKEFGGTVQPFDVYQGPYVVIGDDVRSGSEPYAIAVQHLGVVRLWIICDGDGGCQVYNEANDRCSEYFPEDSAVSPLFAIEAAREVLAE